MTTERRDPGSRAAIGLAIAIACSAPWARAAEPELDVCAAAAVHGQQLRRAGRLVEARRLFASCARTACREDIARDCAGWRDELDEHTPRLTVTVRDERGAPLAGCAVRIDGAVADAAASGRPVALDPGPHVVRVERGGYLPYESTITATETEPLTLFSATLVPAAAAAPASPPSAARGLAPFYAAAGFAIAGFTGFGVAAAVGDADWNRSSCGTACDRSDAARVRGELLAADIALAVGLVATGLATWLYLRPASSSTRGAAAAVAWRAR